MSVTKVMRHMLREYYGIPTAGTGGTITWTFNYINPGFTQLNEEGGAETEEEAYIGDKNSTTTVTGYKNSWAYECKNLRGDPVCDDLRDIALKQKVGSDCERQLVSIDLSDPVESGGTPSTTEFHARKFDISVEAAPPQGEPKSTTTMSGNLHQLGNMVEGKFNISTNTFTANE